MFRGPRGRIVKAKSELILGVGFGTHDSAICLMRNGAILSALEQERADRQKGSKAPPVDALQLCLTQAQLELPNVDVIASPMIPWRQLSRVLARPESFTSMRAVLRTELDTVRGVNRYLYDLKRRSSGRNARLVRFRHHDCHAASALWAQPNEESAILVVDGIGETDTVSIYSGDKSRGLKCLRRYRFPHSIGKVYGAVCRHLGFWGHSKEGRVMGLAAHGQPTFAQEFADMLWPGGRGFNVDTPLFRLSASSLHPSLVSPLFESRFGPGRAINQLVTLKHADLAASLQAGVTTALKGLVRQAMHLAERSEVTLAGGVALNCSANGEIARLPDVSSLFVPPYPHDGGLAIGAAVLASGSFREHPSGTRGARLGPQYSRTDVVKAAAILGLSPVEHSIEDVAALLARGYVLGWFQGRAEFGPRALGGRSILADARDLNVRRRINDAVKERDSFRPLAPCVKRDRASTIFELPYDTPYMSMSVPVRPDWWLRIPAVVHEDKSARVQTVDSDSEPELYRLLEVFEEITACPVLINTSFNGHDEPLVLTPTDAILSGQRIGLDGVWMDGLYVDLPGGSRRSIER